jgi:hypothetical protein
LLVSVVGSSTVSVPEANGAPEESKKAGLGVPRIG